MNLLERWQVGRRPALIVGHGRSGTTWVGNVAAQAPRVLYYFEPMAPNISGRGDLRTWFHFAPAGQDDPFLAEIFDPVFRGLPPDNRRWRRGRVHRLLPGYRIVVKEVAALMSAAWLAERYDPAVAVIIRHPCPTVLSEIRRSVPAEDSRRVLLDQQALFDSHLGPYRGVIESASSPLEVLAAVWAARYRVVADQIAARPGWKLVCYEELAVDPASGFRDLFSHCGLPWSARVEDYVRFSSTSDDRRTYSGIRVSRDQVDSWKGQITPAELAAVRRTVEAFDLPFYRAAADWTV